jgi:hypothetical protein
MAYRKFHDRLRGQARSESAPKTLATLATLAGGTGQNQKSGSSEINDLGLGAPAARVEPTPSPDFQKSRGTPAKVAKVAKVGTTDAAASQRPTEKPQQNTEKSPSGNRAASGNGKAVSEGGQLCDHCGQPGAEPWRVDGRTVYLHDQCQWPWADENLDLHI